MEASISSSPATYAGIVQVLDTVDEASRKSMKEELLKTLEESKSQLNVETKAKKVIDENDGLILDVKDKVDRSKETVSDSVKLPGWGRWDRGSAPRRSKVDPQLVQHWFRAKEEASRNSQEEPPLKKKKLEEGVRVNKPISFGLTEFLAKHAERIADGTAAHQFDYMSPKPWFPETIVNPYEAP